ncbi:methionyl-tRNA formyltransferase [Marinicella sp. W31]|uniref:methionyl-tRNA formyltransferase n=1 Tax=Marinicella sp. W31 TaxID=3023713 RepID=UPI0037570769
MDKKSLNIIFCGTPEFSVPPLQALIDSEHTVTAVFTQPDRKAGRGKKLTASPVKELALKHDIPVHQPTTLRTDDTLQKIQNLQADLMIVVAYGLIVPQQILDIPQHGCWNIHASLLPRWRGAAPIQRAILAGDEITGVGIMQMEAGLDTGPVFLEKTTTISAEDTSTTLHDRLSDMGADALMDCIHRLVDGTLPDPTPQFADAACYAHKLEKSESLIDWQKSAVSIERQIRAFNPWPGSLGHIQGDDYKIWKAHVLPTDDDLTAGTIVKANAQQLHIRCGEASLGIEEIQAAGKKRLSIGQFMAARTGWYCG